MGASQGPAGQVIRKRDPQDSGFLLTGILASELEEQLRQLLPRKMKRRLGMTYNIFTHSQVTLHALRIFSALVPFPPRALGNTYATCHSSLLPTFSTPDLRVPQCVWSLYTGPES